MLCGLVALWLGCAAGRPPELPASVAERDVKPGGAQVVIPKEASLVGEISVAPAVVSSVGELAVQVVVRSDGREAATLNATFLAYPSVVLQVRDAAGLRVMLGPPPVPPSDPSGDLRSVAPGGAERFSYAGSSFAGPPLKPGRYEVRLSVQPVGQPERLESAWAAFVVKNAG